MEKDLRHYIKVYKGIVPIEICDQTINELEFNLAPKWQQHAYHSAVTGDIINRNGSNELDINSGQPTTAKILEETIWKSLQLYLSELNMPWYNSWQGFESIRFNRYKENQIMSEHCDHIHTIFPGEKRGIPIMSTLGSLNNNYSGGEFIMFGDEYIKLDKGDIVVFPSNFLYPHRVEPVTNGTRYSFVSWVW
jgi:predicted 2-oxoglutarate/Fe(II)-dependent dioxygenase YbiX